MSLQIAPAGTLVLALNWLGQPGITYTLQTSTDLNEWQTIDAVITGTGSMESYFIPQYEGGNFARLRTSSTGDTNDNGLPDQWEWLHFGIIDVDPDADPDEDGMTNYIEWLQQSDPMDFYNGEIPSIRIGSGTDWLVPTGKMSSQALSITVLHESGEQWENAPVDIRVESGLDSIVLYQTLPAAPVPGLRAWTDSLGRINPGIQSIHVLATHEAGTVDSVEVRAGKSTTAIRIHSVGNDFGPPPRELQSWTDGDGLNHYTWKSGPGSASMFLLQEKSADGNWSAVASIATGDLGDPDPVDGSYHLILQ